MLIAISIPKCIKALVPGRPLRCALESYRRDSWASHLQQNCRPCRCRFACRLAMALSCGLAAPADSPQRRSPRKERHGSPGPHRWRGDRHFRPWSPHRSLCGPCAARPVHNAQAGRVRILIRPGPVAESRTDWRRIGWWTSSGCCRSPRQDARQGVDLPSVAYYRDETRAM